MVKNGMHPSLLLTDPRHLYAIDDPETESVCDILQ